MRFETEQHWLFTENQNFGLVYGLSGKEFYQLELWIIFNFIFLERHHCWFPSWRGRISCFSDRNGCPRNWTRISIYSRYIKRVLFWSSFESIIIRLLLWFGSRYVWQCFERYVTFTFTLRYVYVTLRIIVISYLLISMVRFPEDWSHLRSGGAVL